MEYLREDLLPALKESLNVTPPQVGLLGIGMGGQGALMLSYRFPRQFPVVAALAPAIDFHQLVPQDDPLLTEVFGGREWARQHTPILHVHPLNWPPHQFFCCDPTDYAWFDSSDRLRMKLNSIGIPCTCDLDTSGGGHSWNYFNLMMPRAIQFVLDGLERERLRIV
jgi:S-formylglutathione hydrolase